MGDICTRKMSPEADPVRLSSHYQSDCEDDTRVIYANGDSTVSVKSLKRMKIWKKYLNFSFAGRCDREEIESNEESSDEVDDRLAQIWEDCFDLLELMESALRKVTSTKTEFCNNEDTDVDIKEDDQKVCTDLLESIADQFNIKSLDDVVNSFRVAVFSEESAYEQKSEEIDVQQYINVIKQVKQNMVNAGNSSFDLYLITTRMYKTPESEWHAQRSLCIWQKVFRIFSGLEKVSEKLSQLSASVGCDIDDMNVQKRSSHIPSDQTFPHSSCDKEFLVMLNIMVRLVSGKQVNSQADIANLITNVKGLRSELTKEHRSFSFAVPSKQSALCRSFVC